MSFLNAAPQDSLLDSPGSSAFDLPTQQQQDGIGPAGTRDQRHATTGLGDNIVHPDEGPSFVVVSGGTGGNSICSAFGNATYVLPVSDDGGSSSEIIRVIGGPSVGEHITTGGVQQMSNMALHPQEI